MVSTYDDCAKQCIGSSGCVTFDWNYDGSKSECNLYSSGGFLNECCHND